MNGQDFINFAQSTLATDSRFADVDMSPSSAFYNLVLLPFSLLSKPVFDLHDNMVNSMSLSQMSGTQLDDFATMFFVTRPTQTYVTVQIQIYLPIQSSSGVEPLTVQTTDEFRTSQNSVFYPVQDYIFAYGSLPTTTIVVGGGSLGGISTVVYCATILASSTSANSQVLANSITSTSLTYTLGILGVNNPSASSVPLPAETDSEFKATIQNTLTLRNNINPSSIITNLTNAFPFATFQPIGYGDPEMQRDIAVAAQYWSGHFGGMTDIYVNAQLVPAIFSPTPANVTLLPGNIGYQFEMQAYKGFDWSALDTSTPNSLQLLPWTLLDSSNLPTLPLVLLDSVSISNSNISITNDVDGRPKYKIEVYPDPGLSSFGKNYRYSQYENLLVKIYCTASSGTLPSNPTITLNYQTLPSIADMQAFINNDNNRVMCSNTLVKSFIPIQIEKLEIVYDKNYTIDIPTWTTKIVNLINNWSTNAPIAFSTLLEGFPAPYRQDEIYVDNGSNFPYTFDSNGLVTGLNQSTTSYPCYALIRANNIDGTYQVYVSTNKIAPRYTTAGLSSSYRTCRYVIEPSAVTFTTGSW